MELLARLPELRALGRPLLVGPSRKSFIGAVTGAPPEERLAGTLAAVTAAVLGGATFVRVHDVAAARQAARVAAALRASGEIRARAPRLSAREASHGGQSGKRQRRQGRSGSSSAPTACAASPTSTP